MNALLLMLALLGPGSTFYDDNEGIYPDQEPFVTSSGVTGDVIMGVHQIVCTHGTACMIGNPTGGGILTWPADGQLTLTDSTASTGFRLDFNTADTLTLLTQAGASGAILNVGTGAFWMGALSRSLAADGTAVRLRAGTQLQLVQRVDNSLAGGAMMSMTPLGPTIELTASSGIQYGFELLPNVGQSGTAAAEGLFLNVTETTRGSGQYYLFRTQWDDVDQFSVKDDGETAIYSAKGATTYLPPPVPETVTFANDAFKDTTGTALPKGCILAGVTGRVTTVLAGCTSVDVGTAGTQDLFADDVNVADGTTFFETPGANWSFPVLADEEIRVTANGGNCTSGAIAVSTHCIRTSAATVD